jgi:hypothetical protein
MRTGERFIPTEEYMNKNQYVRTPVRTTEELFKSYALTGEKSIHRRMQKSDVSLKLLG